MSLERTRTANPSAFGRLAKGVSWEGIEGLRRFRDGGVGSSDVLQAEVLYALDMLPREAFLGTVVERAHGADEVRALVVAEIEQARLDLSAEEVFLNPSGAHRAARGVVQPDALLESPSTVTVLELRPVRPRPVPKHQLAKLCACALLAADGRSPLLFVVLAAPPPFAVTGNGRLDLVEATAQGLAEVLAAAGTSALRPHQVAEMVAWTTWPEVADIVRNVAKGFEALNASLRGSVERLSSSLTESVARHGTDAG